MLQQKGAGIELVETELGFGLGLKAMAGMGYGDMEMWCYEVLVVCYHCVMGT